MEGAGSPITFPKNVLFENFSGFKKTSKTTKPCLDVVLSLHCHHVLCWCCVWAFAVPFPPHTSAQIEPGFQLAFGVPFFLRQVVSVELVQISFCCWFVVALGRACLFPSTPEFRYWDYWDGHSSGLWCLRNRLSLDLIVVAK
jgi:hypothetical protein